MDRNAAWLEEAERHQICTLRQGHCATTYLPCPRKEIAERLAPFLVDNETRGLDLLHLAAYSLDGGDISHLISKVKANMQHAHGDRQQASTLEVLSDGEEDSSRTVSTRSSDASLYGIAQPSPPGIMLGSSLAPSYGLYSDRGSQKQGAGPSTNSHNQTNGYTSLHTGTPVVSDLPALSELGDHQDADSTESYSDDSATDQPLHNPSPSAGPAGHLIGAGTTSAQNPPAAASTSQSNTTAYEKRAALNIQSNGTQAATPCQKCQKAFENRQNGARCRATQLFPVCKFNSQGNRKQCGRCTWLKQRCD